jgi:hypothetical protein
MKKVFYLAMCVMLALTGCKGNKAADEATAEEGYGYVEACENEDYAPALEILNKIADDCEAKWKVEYPAITSDSEHAQEHYQVLEDAFKQYGEAAKYVLLHYADVLVDEAVKGAGQPEVLNKVKGELTELASSLRFLDNAPEEDEYNGSPSNQVDLEKNARYIRFATAQDALNAYGDKLLDLAIANDIQDIAKFARFDVIQQQIILEDSMIRYVIDNVEAAMEKYVAKWGFTEDDY